jgi:hypothetical protein
LGVVIGGPSDVGIA